MPYIYELVRESLAFFARYTNINKFFYKLRLSCLWTDQFIYRTISIIKYILVLCFFFFLCVCVCVCVSISRHSNFILYNAEMFDLTGILLYKIHCRLCDWQRVSISMLLHLPGVPLPLIGMVAYGLVASLGLQLSRKNLPFGMDEPTGRLIILGSTTSMAAASAYFLYILGTKFSGASCSYCLMSALLSFSLFFISLRVSFLFSFLSLGCWNCCNWFLSIIRCFWGLFCRILGWKKYQKWLVYSYV